ncbi:MAG: hypothetical protein GXP09_00945 [Gammaproteobacteria bacterium]|nr:hypothetical protein [Gammaproteobacteria bacterium]
MPNDIAQQWLQSSARTAKHMDLDAHMNLISKRVSLTGVPGFESIGYDDWAAQCRHEFENGLIKDVRYDGFKPLGKTPNRIMFKTCETVEAKDGTVTAQGIEVLLEQEEDGVWRLLQERVLPEDEARHDKLIASKL